MELINVNQLKAIQLEIMDSFHEWCIQNGITYYLTAGSLIGALRHKGFIPWDDDIDVVMLRADYERMLRLFPSDGIYRLCSYETDVDCVYTYAKIYDPSTIMIEGNDRHIKNHIGVNIDIFPLDNATDNYEDAKKLKEDIKVWDNILSVKHLDRVDRGVLKNITVSCLRFVSKLFSFAWLIKTIIRKSKKFVNNEDSRYVVNAVIYAKGEREILERDWFRETVDLEFEGRKYKAPIGADQYMRRLFGDYMKLPPEDKRVSHHRFKAYKK